MFVCLLERIHFPYLFYGAKPKIPVQFYEELCVCGAFSTYLLSDIMGFMFIVMSSYQLTIYALYCICPDSI